jgi:carbohydrate-selective porin OprB
MWSYAGLSSASGAVGNESIVELYYTLAATGSVSLSPYFQWVSNPSGNPAIDDAVLVGLSVKVSF